MTDLLKPMSKVIVSDGTKEEPIAHLTLVLDKGFGVAFADESLFNSTIVNLSDIPVPLLKHIVREASSLLEKGSVRIEEQHFSTAVEQGNRESN